MPRCARPSKSILAHVENASRRSPCATCRRNSTTGIAEELPLERRRDRAARSRRCRNAISTTSSSRRRRCATSRRSRRDTHARPRGRDPAGRDPRPPPHPGGEHRLLRAGRTLSDGRLGAHVDRHRQGRRGEAHHRLRAAVQGRAASGDRRGDAFRRRRRDLRARRRAGGRRDGARHRDHPAGRHDRRPRQRLCRRGQAPAVRPRRHRSVRRPDRDPGHRRRDGRRRDVRHRPARPGRARADLARRC